MSPVTVLEACDAHAAGVARAGWSGGQYSAFRAALGGLLLLCFAELLPWGGQLPWPAAAAASALSLLLLLGWQDRPAALLLLCLWNGAAGREARWHEPGGWAVTLLLLLHAAMPAAPYGSLAARGRLDPGGGWRHPRALRATAWVLLVLGSAAVGLLKLGEPEWLDGSALRSLLTGPTARAGVLRDALLGLPPVLLSSAGVAALGLLLLGAPIALVPRLRPWLWGALLGMQVVRLLLVDPSGAGADDGGAGTGASAGTGLGMLLGLFFTFDPAWIPARGGPGPSTVHFDGHCGLCHRFVRLLLAEDEDGLRFRFAPLQGETFAAFVRARGMRELPDSLVLVTPCGDLLLRSDAVLHCLRRIGGLWRLLGLLLRLVPRPLRDLGYDAVARIRRVLFRQPPDVCPLLPERLRGRMLP